MKLYKKISSKFWCVSHETIKKKKKPYNTTRTKVQILGLGQERFKKLAASWDYLREGFGKIEIVLRKKEDEGWKISI